MNSDTKCAFNLYSNPPFLCSSLCFSSMFILLLLYKFLSGEVSVELSKPLVDGFLQDKVGKL